MLASKPADGRVDARMMRDHIENEAGRSNLVIIPVAFPLQSCSLQLMSPRVSPPSEHEQSKVLRSMDYAGGSYSSGASGTLRRWFTCVS